MINILKKICSKTVGFFRLADEIARYKAVDGLEDEIEEMEYLFAILVQGSFVGMPSPPVHLSLSLLPEMEREMNLLLDRVVTSNQPISKLFSTFDIG